MSIEALRNVIHNKIENLRKKDQTSEEDDLEQIEQLIAQCKDYSLQEQLVELLLLKARSLSNRDKVDLANPLFDEAMFIAESLNSIHLQTSVYLNRAAVKKKYCLYDESINLDLKALELLDKTDSYDLLCSTLQSIGASYWRKGDSPNSFKYLQKALKVANENNLLRSQAEILAWLSEIELENENYEKAAEIMIQSNNILLDLDDWQNYASNLNVIGTYHVSNLDQSLFYYKKAEKISRANNYVDELSNALNNIGAVYFDKKEYDTALEYYKESLDISSNYKYTTNYANTLLNIADIYKFQNNYTKSLEHYKKGLQIFKNTDSPYAIIEGYTSLSEFYYHFAEYDNALQSVERILAQAIEMDDSSYLMRIYKVYYQAYEQKGLYEKAYESLNLYRKYFNSFENHATMKTLKNISNQFEKDIIEREAKKATQEEAIKGKIAMTVTANHHLNQPLMVLQGNLDLLQYKLEKYKIYTCSENFNNLQRSINSFAKYLAEHNSHKER